MRRYAGSCVIGRVTERDASGQPRRVKIISVGDRYSVRNAFSALDEAVVFLAVGVPREPCAVVL